MRRGDIFYVNFNPAQGSEANKIRPAAIVSQNEANSYAEQSGRGTLTVVPITSNTKFVASFQVLVSAQETGLKYDSKVQAEQIRTVSVHRVGDYIGTLNPSTLWLVDEALKLHLSL